MSNNRNMDQETVEQHGSREQLSPLGLQELWRALHQRGDRGQSWQVEARGQECRHIPCVGGRTPAMQTMLVSLCDKDFIMIKHKKQSLKIQYWNKR